MLKVMISTKEGKKELTINNNGQIFLSGKIKKLRQDKKTLKIYSTSGKFVSDSIEEIIPFLDKY